MSDNNKALHRVLRKVAGWAVWSFFSDVHVIGAANVPRDGPMIVVSTHHNMMLDPAVLSSSFPHRRILNYWSKASLFANPILRRILLSSGNIPVERKSKDNQVLFKGTFDVLARGEAVALFPEGTSYTEPRIMQIKDGASWSALEYMKWAKQNPDKATSQPLEIIPVAIVYTNKSKYRSEVIVEFGPPIMLADFEDQFLSSVEGEPRAAVKRLSQRIESELIRMTINAPDWDTMFMARMTRSILWEKSKDINLDDFVSVSQTLVDLFSTPDVTSNAAMVKRRLLEYYSLLQSSKLNNSALASLPLPKSLDPRRAEPLPSRLRTLFLLLRDTFAVLVRLPFFLVPLMVHLPAYVAARFAARMVEHEEETQAQNKVVFGLLFLFIIYPAIFFFLWALFGYTFLASVVAFATVCLFAVYHVKMIDDNYDHAKQLVAAWRVLVGIWVPKRSELSMAALQQYLVPKKPAESEWIDKKPTTTAPHQRGGLSTNSEPTASTNPKKRGPPTRRLVRHVLRARSRAVMALAAFFAELDKNADGNRIYASAHLAAQYGGFSGTPRPKSAEGAGGAAERELRGWRDAREVLTFLRNRGAKMASLQTQLDGEYWTATGSVLSEGEEDYSSDSINTDKDNEDLVWIAPAIQ